MRVAKGVAVVSNSVASPTEEVLHTFKIAHAGFAAVRLHDVSMYTVPSLYMIIMGMLALALWPSGSAFATDLLIILLSKSTLVSEPANEMVKLVSSTPISYHGSSAYKTLASFASWGVL